MPFSIHWSLKLTSLAIINLFNKNQILHNLYNNTKKISQYSGGGGWKSGGIWGDGLGQVTYNLNKMFVQGLTDLMCSAYLCRQ